MTAEGRTNLWRASAAEHVSAPPIDQSVSVDLAVVGGGFTGCSAALEAARLGAKVCLLEAETIGHGGSGRNVGLVNAGLWLPPDRILAEMGEDAGCRLIDALSLGPETVFDLIAREGLDCEQVRNGTLHCAHAPAGMADLSDRFRQGNRFGAPLQLLSRDEAVTRTGSAAFHGALFDPRAGTVQPLSYCRGLARAAQRAGARIHERSGVTDIARDGDCWVLQSNGAAVRSKALLIATNAYHFGIETPFRPSFATVSFSQFATVPLPETERDAILPRGEGCWDTALVMSSVRLDRAGRLIVGSIGNAEGIGGPVHAGWARRKLNALYPSVAHLPFEHAWTGRIAMASDHIPKIVAFGPNGFACFGYSGRGIGPGTVFGRDAATVLLGGDPATLPLDPIPHYAERFTGLRTAYFEAGAALTHAIRPGLLSGRSKSRRSAAADDIR